MPKMAHFLGTPPPDQEREQAQGPGQSILASILDLLRPPQAVRQGLTDVAEQGPLLGMLLTLARNPALVQNIAQTAPAQAKEIYPLFGGEAGMEGPLSKAVAMYPELAKGAGLGSKLFKRYGENRPGYTSTPEPGAVTPPVKIGSQRGIGKLPGVDLYNDPVTGTAFAVEKGGDVNARLAEARKRFGIETPTPARATAVKASALNTKALGTDVPAAEFKQGWITPDGKMYNMGRRTHAVAMEAASGKEAFSYPRTANEHNAIRYGGTYQDGAQVELFNHEPTDEQISTLREIEKRDNMPVAFSLTDPFIGPQGSHAGGNYGVNRIRRTIKDVNFSPVYSEPIYRDPFTGRIVREDPWKRSEALPQTPPQPSLMDFLNPPTLTPAFGGYPNANA